MSGPRPTDPGVATGGRALPRATVRELLGAQRDAIVRSWATSTRRAVPFLADRVAGILDAVAQSSAVELIDDLDTENIVAELQLLRRAIHRVNAREPRPVSAEDLDRVDEAIDAAIYDTCVRRRRETEELRSSEALLRTMFDHYPAPMWIKDTDGRYVMSNLAHTTLIGATASTSVVGHLEDEFFPSQATDAYRANDQVVLERETPLEFEEWAPYKGENHRFLSIKFNATGPNNRRLICGIATDITARKRIEDGERFLIEAGRLLGTTLDFEDALARVVKLAIPMLADAFTVDLVENGKLRRLTFAPDDAMEDAVHEFVACGPPALDSNRIVPVVIRTESAIVLPELDEPTVRRFDTPPNIISALRKLGIKSVMVAPLIGRTGVLGTLAFAGCDRRYGPADLAVAEGLARIATDTMENSRLYAAAQDAIRQREDVLAIVSHDLRSPLATVRAALHGLTDCAESDSHAKRLEIIDRATQRMDRMIGDLLQAAAIRAGRLAVAPRPESLRTLLAEALEAHFAVAKRLGIQLVGALDGPPLVVSCDRDRVAQMLSNLLGNSLKFCRSGDTITVGVERLEREARVIVSDTGPGIREEDLAHLFDPYWSARRDATKGTGLGLYISKGLVEAQGGRMGVESHLGRGTTFWFTLPRS